MKRLLAALALIAAATPVCAPAASVAAGADRWYEVEVIVFAHTGADGAASELWPVDPGTPALDEAVELAPAVPGGVPAGDRAPIPPPLPFQAIDEADLRLGGLVNKLMLSPDHVPLLHLGWRQPVPAEPYATGVRIGTQTTLTLAEGDTGLKDLLTPPRQGTLFPENRGDESRRIDGLIRLSRSRYLHLEADLLLRNRPVRPDPGPFSIFRQGVQRPEVFRMHQSRRIRSGELHYFDHPLFGLIALLTPYDPPQRAGEDGDGGHAPADGTR